jgi:hypothetical protein
VGGVPGPTPLNHPHLTFAMIHSTQTTLLLSLRYAPGGELYKHLTARGRFDERTSARVGVPPAHRHIRHLTTDHNTEWLAGWRG